MVNRIGYTDYVNIEHLDDFDNPHDTTYTQVDGASSDHDHYGVYLELGLVDTFEYLDDVAVTHNHLSNYTTTGTWEYFAMNNAYIGAEGGTISYTYEDYNDYAVVYQYFKFEPQTSPFQYYYHYAKDRRINIVNNVAKLQKYTSSWVDIGGTSTAYSWTIGNDITVICDWSGNIGTITVNGAAIMDNEEIDLPNYTGEPLMFSCPTTAHVHKWRFLYTPIVDIVNALTFAPEAMFVPFVIPETHDTIVAYLNADMLDDYHASEFATSDHDHDGVYSGASHDHDSDYSPIDHNHNSSYAVVSTGTDVPSSTPSKVGDIYVDTSNKKLYFATGNGASSDWTIAN
jgi:hypothetical protein